MIAITASGSGHTGGTLSIMDTPFRFGLANVIRYWAKGKIFLRLYHHAIRLLCLRSRESYAD